MGSGAAGTGEDGS